jgi:hypothetical protein
MVTIEPVASRAGVVVDGCVVEVWAVAGSVVGSVAGSVVESVKSLSAVLLLVVVPVSSGLNVVPPSLKRPR